MFTGIVEEMGDVRSSGPGRLVIDASKVMEDMKLGASICVNGACLTVTDLDRGSFAVDVVPETLRRTNLGGLRAGDRVNLERPVAAAGRLDGHIVQGHVDGTAEVDSVAEEGEALMVGFRADESIMRYVVEKGFVSVDGISLTIVDCGRESFSVTVIPYTRENTVLGARRTGDVVNVEADILAKYLERLSAFDRSG